MKKKLLVAVSLLSVSMLAACEEAQIMYEGEKYPKSEVEEHMADKLEVENPDMDLEVSIMQEED